MISFPFDSQITGTDEAGLPIYDRASNSEDLARWFEAFFTNGIFATSGFAVTVSGLTVSVAPGDCLINGRYGYEKNTRTFSIAGGGSQPRIDAVVLRLDLSLDKRNIDLYVKTGTAATTPVAPALDRNETVWELGIANIRVNASQTAVSQSAVTDTRLDTSRCGIVAQAMKTIDTSTYYAQIQADLNEFKQNEQADFEAWFETVQAALDGDTAGNLLNMINAIMEQIPSETNPLPVSSGGTGATTPETARANLEITPSNIGAVVMKTATASLPASGWDGNYQTVSVNYVTASNTVIVTAAPASYEHYNECAVRCIAQGDGELAFACTDKPTSALTANVLILE